VNASRRSNTNKPNARKLDAVLHQLTEIDAVLQQVLGRGEDELNLFFNELCLKQSFFTPPYRKVKNVLPNRGVQWTKV